MLRVGTTHEMYQTESNRVATDCEKLLQKVVSCSTLQQNLYTLHARFTGP